jgi:hypothetical protein
MTAFTAMPFAEIAPGVSHVGVDLGLKYSFQEDL